MRLRGFLLVLLGLVGGPGPAGAAETAGRLYTPADDLAGAWTFTPDPALPDVLLIGDSISIGYTRQVRSLLQGRANVHRVMSADGQRPDNGGDTHMALASLDRWLAGHRWRVIHFNWGLWDICYRNPASKNHGNRDKTTGTLAVTPEDYARNLEQLVLRMKDTGATLIWASTTVVPPGEPGRFVGDEIKYNRIAREIMTRHGVLINDLYPLTTAMPADKFRAPADVHYTPDGYAEIARQVAAAVGDHLQP